MANEEPIENPIIYVHPTSTMVSEPTLSLPDEEADIIVSSRPSSSSGTSSSWLKRNYLPVTLAFLVLSGVVLAAVVFRPGGAGNPRLEANMAINRGIDTMTDAADDVPRPTPLKGEENPPQKPLKGQPKEEQIDIPESYVPTPFPSSLKPTFPSALDFSGLTPIPTPPPSLVPTTNFPTITVTGQVSETVSTEVTGPPTLQEREG